MLLGVDYYPEHWNEDMLQEDLNNIIEILKNNYSKVKGFELLRSIDISIDDLLDTSEDISKLVLRR